MDGYMTSMVVRTETEHDFKLPVAIIFGGSGVATCLSEIVSKQGVKVDWVQRADDLQTEVQARYLFLFLESASFGSEGERLVQKFCDLGIKLAVKLVVILEGLAETEVERVEAILKKTAGLTDLVEIRSAAVSLEKQSEIATKILRMGFSSRTGGKLIIGEFGGKQEQTPSVIEKKAKERKPEKKQRLGGLALALLIILIFFMPFIVVGGLGGLIGKELLEAKTEVNVGNFERARELTGSAGLKVSMLSEICEELPVFGPMKYVCDGLLDLKLATETVNLGIGMHGDLTAVFKGFFLANEAVVNLREFAPKMAVTTSQIEENLGFLEAEISKNYGVYAWVYSKLGFSQSYVEGQLSKIPEIRFLAKAGREILPVLPEILGMEDEKSNRSGKRTYLLVFQNSAELRGGGGFVGSYAIAHVDGGKLLDFKINDIYSADGQLKGRVVPPDEILHFLGQPAWFMRDANISPDFPLSAKRLAWFLEKETGQHVDGVAAINLEAVEKILEGIGPVSIHSSKEEISAKNFFEKAEYASEINFFPGSTQKRDFLGEVAEAILAKVSNEEEVPLFGLSEKLADALIQKDVMFYFTSPAAQKAFEESGFSGSIGVSNCGSATNCLMVVEDNFGANKANFFLDKKMEVDSTIDKGGGVVNEVKLTIENKSPNDSWPGGRYKSYLRFLIPASAKIWNVDIGSGQQATFSGLLTADVLSKITPREFLVYSTKEEILSTKGASDSGIVSLGMQVEIPAKSKKEIKIKYSLKDQLDFSKKEDKYSLSILKQSGSVFDPLKVVIGHPTFLEPAVNGGVFRETPIVKNQELIYNSVLDRDRKFEILFKQI